MENEIKKKCPEIFELVSSNSSVNWTEVYNSLEKLSFLSPPESLEQTLNNAIHLVDDMNPDSFTILSETPTLLFLNSLVFSLCLKKSSSRQYLENFLEQINDLSLFKSHSSAIFPVLESRFSKKCSLFHKIFMHLENLFISSTKKTIPQYLNDLFYNYFISSNLEELSGSAEGREILKKYPKPRYFYIPFISKMPGYVNNYFGEYENDKKHGFGLLSLINGDQFKGEFYEGLMHGQGTYYWASGGYYEGEFFKGVFHGFGSEHFVSGNVYVGEFVHGKKHGKGEMKFANGDRYSGEWRFNSMEGEGEFIWSSGVVFKGWFARDKRQGHGEITMENGTKHEGDWENDELV